MQTIGGYRIVRKIGAGARADIHLGHSGSGEATQHDTVAAIKVYRAIATEASIDIEIEALARASSPHLLTLTDLATGPDQRPCLILPRLGTGTLARLLAMRGTIAAGESVSILVPMIEAVQELHRVGVSHGAVVAGSVLFDGRGAPVLAKFGAANLIGNFPATEGGRSLTPAELEADAGAQQDRVGLRELVKLVLDRIERPANGGPLAAIRARINAAPPNDFDLAGLVDLLFELAPALPILFEGESAGESWRNLFAPATSPSTAAVGGQPQSNEMPTGNSAFRPNFSPAPRLSAVAATATDDRNRMHRPARLHWPAKLRSLLQLPPILLLRKIAAPVRTPVWIVGGVGLVALLLALFVLGADPALPSVDPGAGSGPKAIGSQLSAGQAQQKQSSSVDAAAAITGDDPIQAAQALLVARTGCFAKRSLTCLDAVDQAGSAALEADGEQMRRLKKGVPIPPEIALEGFTPHLVQRLGNLAIVQLTAAESNVQEPEPAPLLLVSSGAGWRIRDLNLG